MKLTLASLKETVQEELGRGPARSTSEALVNEAGEAWVNAHEWRYLRDRSQDLNIEVGVESYRLGLGVRSVEAVYRPDSHYCEVPIIDFAAFEGERQQFLARSQYLQDPIGTVRWDTKEGDERPRLYLELFPIEFAERFVIRFHAGWLPLDEMEDVADIPGPLSTAFLHWLRMYANHREFPDQYGLGALDTLMRSNVFRKAMSIDGEAAGRIIPAPGGAGAYYNRHRASQRFGSTVWTPDTIRRELDAL